MGSAYVPQRLAKLHSLNTHFFTNFENPEWEALEVEQLAICKKDRRTVVTSVLANRSINDGREDQRQESLMVTKHYVYIT